MANQDAAQGSNACENHASMTDALIAISMVFGRGEALELGA